MGVTAENLAEMYEISREAHDEFAVNSQRKAATAQVSGRLAEEIMPVLIPQRKADEAFSAQSIACLMALGLQVDDPRVNINGGAIALGHPLGMSGTRITYSAAL